MPRGEEVTNLVTIANKVTEGTGVSYVISPENLRVTPVFEENCNPTKASNHLVREANRRVGCNDPQEYLVVPDTLTPEEETLVLSLLTLSLETYAGNPKFPWSTLPLTWDIPNGPNW